MTEAADKHTLKCDTQETKYPMLRLVTPSLINKTNVLWWRFSIVNISTDDFWKENSQPLSTFSFSKGIIFQHTVSAVLQRELKTAAASKSKEKIFALKTLEWALTSWYYYLFWIVIMNQFQIYSTSIHILTPKWDILKIGKPGKYPNVIFWKDL